jgi:hypothetical protein
MFTTEEQDEFFSQEKCNICFSCEILGVITEHLIIRVPCANCRQNNFGCPGCGKKYSTENRLMNHFYENHSQTPHCLHCGDETSFNRLFSHTVSHFSKTIDKYEPDFNEILENNIEYEDLPVHVTSPNQIEQTEPLFPSKSNYKFDEMDFNKPLGSGNQDFQEKLSIQDLELIQRSQRKAYALITDGNESVYNLIQKAFEFKEKFNSLSEPVQRLTRDVIFSFLYLSSS